MFSIDKTKLVNSINMRLSKSLFLELSYSDKTYVVYTLKKQDHEGYPSLYLLFLQYGLVDPTEYLFAKNCFLDWDHWSEVSNSSWLKEIVASWRLELQAALESQYVSKMTEIANKGGKEAFPALRYLLERAEKAAGRSSVGRPRKGTTKSEIQHTAFLGRLEEKQVDNDLQRIQGKVN